MTEGSHVSAVYIGCGGRLTGVTQGIIASPGYPNNYPANMNCTWTVSVLSGRTITVTVETLSIATASGVQCLQDKLRV